MKLRVHSEPPVEADPWDVRPGWSKSTQSDAGDVNNHDQHATQGCRISSAPPPSDEAAACARPLTWARSERKGCGSDVFCLSARPKVQSALRPCGRAKCALPPAEPKFRAALRAGRPLGRSQGVSEQASFDLPLPKHRRKRKFVAPARPRDAAFAEALRDAADIRQWTDARVAPWRVYRLAQALIKAP